MFDIGFAELLIIGVVALLVIGPERLPEAVRTASAWINRLRRGFNDIKQEVQQELHNDQVMRELRESGESLRRETDSLRRELNAPITGTTPVDQGAAADQPATASLPADTASSDTPPKTSD